MGPRAGRPSRLRHPGVLLALLVAVDHATKLAALALLPRGEEVDWDAGFQLVLRFNESGVGAWASYLWPEATRAEMAAGWLAWLALAAALLAVRRWDVRRRWRVLTCIAAFVLGAIAEEPLAPLLERMSDHALQVLDRATGAACVLTVWWLVPRGLWKTTLTLFAATALGNGLSLLYPSFRVVDFVYSRHLWDTTRMGVFNFADLCYVAGLVLLAWATLRAVGRRLRPRRGRATRGAIEPPTKARSG